MYSRPKYSVTRLLAAKQLTAHCLIAGLVASNAYAQDSSAETEQNFALEEVIVTAQKKSESIQDTPISITAFGEDALEARGIEGIGDLQAQVPSMSIDPFPINTNTLRIFIRGIGSTGAQITQDSPVSIYQDGVHFARPNGLALDIADVERIEILRGPQGTLYGRNSTGGAISIVTRRPSVDAFGLQQHFTIGDRNLFSSKTMVNVPLGETVAVKLSHYQKSQDGFVENLGPGGDFGDSEAEAFVLSALWQPSDTLEFYYNYDQTDTEVYQYMAQSVLPGTEQGNQGDQINENAAERSVFSNKRLDALTTTTPYLPNNADIKGHSIVTSLEINDSTTLRYIASQREIHEQIYVDLGGGAGDEFFRGDWGAWQSLDGSVSTPATREQFKQEQLTHEVNLLGTIGERLEYITGVFYIEEEASDIDTLRHSLSALLDASPLDNLLLTSLLDRELYAESEAWAAFIQLNWRPDILEERLELVFGYRHSEDRRWARKRQNTTNYVQEVGLALPLPPTVLASSEFADTETERDFTDDSLSFIANFAVNDDINVYAKLIEAYRTGFFNLRDPDPARFAEGVDAEKVRSLELGFKGDLLDRRLRFNLNAFFSEYKDMQIGFLIPGTIADTQITNAGTAEMGGLEMDLMFLVTRNWMLSLNYGLLDTEITEVTAPDGSDATDDYVFFSAPHHTWSASSQYTFFQGDAGRLSLNLSANFMDERAGSGLAASARNTYTSAFTLANARLSYDQIALFGGELSLAAWMKNITDEEYEAVAINNLPQADRSVFWGEPRSYGLDIKLAF